MTTMNEVYKDGSDHTICLKCGFCHTCKDCKCKMPVLEFPQEKKGSVLNLAKLKHKIPQMEKTQKCSLCGKQYYTIPSANNCRCKPPKDRIKARTFKMTTRDEKWKQTIQKL